MNKNYLIPANTKKSMLIFNMFTLFDLILFSSGVGATGLLMFILPVEEVAFTIISLIPAFVCGFLVLPIPNHHNVLTVILSIIEFYTENQKLRWKGWSMYEEVKEKPKKKKVY